MHAESLLLILDELDELNVVVREAASFATVCNLLWLLVALAVQVKTASPLLAVAALIAGLGATTLTEALRDALNAES